MITQQYVVPLQLGAYLSNNWIKFTLTQQTPLPEYPLRSIRRELVVPRFICDGMTPPLANELFKYFSWAPANMGANRRKNMVLNLFPVAQYMITLRDELKDTKKLPAYTIPENNIRKYGWLFAWNFSNFFAKLDNLAHMVYTRVVPVHAIRFLATRCETFCDATQNWLKLLPPHTYFPTTKIQHTVSRLLLLF